MPTGIGIGLSPSFGGAAAGPPPSSLLTGLSSFWPLSDLTDAKGANNLTNNNGVTFGAGKVGNAAYLTAASSMFLNVAAPGFNYSTADWTLAGWWWFNVTGLATMAALGNIASGAEVGLATRNNEFQLQAWNGSATQSVVKLYTQAANTWYWALAQWDSVGKVLSVDFNNSGAPGTLSVPAGLATNGTAFSIGQNDRGFGYLDGRADEVGLWQRLLTSAEKAWIYNAGAGRAYPFAGGP